jgi:BlaI family penicillinase repressor
MEVDTTMASLELFDSEWTILQVIWEKEPCTAPSVQETLQNDKRWAYTTVKTLMDRMVKKGLLRTERLRNLYLYRAAITRQEAQHSEIRRTIQRAFDGALTPMMQFLLENESVSDEEYQDLERLIRNRKRGKTPDR